MKNLRPPRGFGEQHADAEASTQGELKEVIKAARRNFDANNFRRDLDNARTKGLFNRGTGKDSAVLSHYGQNYVDALPDREALKRLRNPEACEGEEEGEQEEGAQVITHGLSVCADRYSAWVATRVARSALRDRT
ncbi:MAG: hypothetical protein M5U09_09150 [Gammaproteobacteria bacterium]|nr:hypothetical protein [Gammaproteobacteria bacterium]